MLKGRRFFGAGLFFAVLTLFCAPLQAALVNSYEFDGDLSDSLGNGADLVANGGIINAGRYDFQNNEGLTLSPALSDTTTYSIEIRYLQNDNFGRYRKLIDYQSLSADFGLYTLDNQPVFFGLGGSGTDFVPADTDVTLLISRDGATNILDVRLNGVLQFSHLDDGSLGVSAVNEINFFVDDTISSQTESFTGSVDYIRIYDTAVVPVPAAFPLLLSALAMGGFFARSTRTP
ncbi:MAG: hypothetical protein AAF387_22375 [Pseudomonadota bacterium]